MSIQQIIGTFFLVCAILYEAYFIRDAARDRVAFEREPGRLGAVMCCEALVYFIATLGVSDFVMNTIVVRRLRLAKPESLPDCLITAGIVPGAVISFLYLRNAGAIDPTTLVVFIACMAVGSFVGSRAVGRMAGDTIKRAMVTLLSLAAAVLVIRMITNQGAVNTATALSGARLVIMGVCTVVFGATNMLGIPAKPFLTTVLLLLGLSPLTTLALILGAIPIAVVTGGINVVRRKHYNRKLAVSAATTGCAGAFIGCALAISINATALNIILVGVIIVAIVSLIKK